MHFIRGLAFLVPLIAAQDFSWLNTELSQIISYEFLHYTECNSYPKICPPVTSSMYLNLLLAYTGLSALFHIAYIYCKDKFHVLTHSLTRLCSHPLRKLSKILPHMLSFSDRCRIMLSKYTQSCCGHGCCVLDCRWWE